MLYGYSLCLRRNTEPKCKQNWSPSNSTTPVIIKFGAWPNFYIASTCNWNRLKQLVKNNMADLVENGRMAISCWWHGVACNLHISPFLLNKIKPGQNTQNQFIKCYLSTLCSNTNILLWVSEESFTSHSTQNWPIRDESFQAIICTGTDNTKQTGEKYPKNTK